MARRRGGNQKPWSPGDRVLVYVRVSKIGNRHDSLISDEIQEEVCRKWADREGLTVVGDPITDLDKTGREATKRQIQHSIARVRRGEAQGIVVWKVSRWGRNLVDSMLNVKELQDAGGFIASATESLDDIETSMGRFSLTQMLAIAQLQSDQIGETWQNIHDYRVSRGLPRSGKDRFGYTKNQNMSRDDDPSMLYSIHPEQAPWVKKAFEMYNGGMSLHQVVRLMRESGVLTNTGKSMCYSSLRRMMDSGFAAGLLVDRREVGYTKSNSPKTTNPNAARFDQGAHPAIIDLATWEAYKKRRAEVRAPMEAAPRFKLSGLMFCGTCGRKLTPILDRKPHLAANRHFKCMRSRHNGSVTAWCPRPVMMREDYVEQVVYSWLTSMAQGEGDYDAGLERKRKADRAKADIKGIVTEIEKLSKRRKRYLDAMIEADDESERIEMDERRQELRGKIMGLEARKAELESQDLHVMVPDPEAFGAAAAAWDTQDVQLVNGALRMIVQRIYVMRSNSRRGDRYSIDKSRVLIVPQWGQDPEPNARTFMEGDVRNAEIQNADQRELKYGDSSFLKPEAELKSH